MNFRAKMLELARAHLDYLSSMITETEVELYVRIKKRRGPKKAIIAIARMMMSCIYYMLSEKKPFEPADYEDLMDPRNQEERVALNENNILMYIEILGYDSSSLVKRKDK